MEKRNILFVDDEINILSALRRGLMDEKFHCIFASGGQEALEVLEKQPVHVIVSDMKMPVMDGLKLLKIVKEKYPDIVRIVLSGYTQLPQVLATVNQADIFKFITKPWQLEEELIPILYQAIDYYDAMKEREDLRKSLEKRNRLYQNVLKATEEKIISDKKNYEGVRQICHYVFDGMEKETAGTSVSNSIKYYRILFLDYLNIAMSNHIKFNLARVVNDLKDAFAGTSLDLKVKIDNNADVSYYGNYGLFQNTVNTLVKMLAGFYNEPKAVISILNSMEEDSVKMYFVIEVKGPEGETPEQNTDTGLERLLPFFNEICKLYSGSLDFNKNNEGKVAKLSCRFKKA